MGATIIRIPKKFRVEQRERIRGINKLLDANPNMRSWEAAREYDLRQAAKRRRKKKKKRKS